MALSIFWRLMAGYSVVLVLSVSLASFSIVQLGRLSGAARTALGRDYRLIAYNERLADVFLSEVRYAGKFIITQAPAHHDQFSQFNKDFDRYMTEIKALTDSPDFDARLARVDEFHRRYRDLFDQEVRYLKARQPYAETRYRQEKENVLESLLRELESLKTRLQKGLQEQLQTIDGAARSTRQIAISTTLLLIGLGIAVSLVVSRSITRPIWRLRNKTAEDPDDGTATDFDFSEIPEIQELAQVLNQAKQKLQMATRANETLVKSLTDEFATPLIAMRRRLTQLEQELSDRATAEQKTNLQILTEENDRLIRRFTQLTQSPAAPPQPQAEPHSKSDNRGDGGPLDQSLDLWRSLFSGFGPRLKHRIQRGCEALTGSWTAIKISLGIAGEGKAKKP